MLSLERRFVDEIIAHALEDDPNECCGILAGNGGKAPIYRGKAVKLYRMTNTEHSPSRYNMDSRELYKVYREIDDSGWDVMAIYHSHTHSPAYPSGTDIRLASWPDAYYVLVSLSDKEHPDVRAFRILDGEATEELLHLD